MSKNVGFDENWLEQRLRQEGINVQVRIKDDELDIQVLDEIENKIEEKMNKGVVKKKLGAALAGLGLVGTIGLFALSNTLYAKSKDDKKVMIAQNIPNSHKMPDMLKKGLVQDPTQGLKPVNSQDWYPELPQQMAYSGGAIASEENSLAKKIKLTDTQFKQLWNQIIEANKKIDVKEANGVSVNGVEGFVVNMDKVLNLAKEREFIIKGKEMKIGNSQWAVNACDKGMVILRKIKMDGEYYLLPPTISFLASLYDDALLDGKLNIYVFNKPMKNSRGEDINLDFAVLRLKDADEYGFSSASERFDLYMLSIGGGSLHVYVEVPKGYEVVGVMPEIVKTNGKLKDGEVVKIYIRGMYLALKDKETGKRVLFYVGVAEGKYGITVSFALAQPNR